MTLTVCFDVLHTCFSLEPLIDALEASMGSELRAAGQGARMVVMEWFHAAQRDFAMLTTINAPAPPPPIAQILRLTLPRSLHFALNGSSPTDTRVSLSTARQLHPSATELSADTRLTPVLEALSHLTPSPGLREAWAAIKGEGGRVVLVTNGAEGATRAYVKQAGLEEFVGGEEGAVVSCEEVGAGKPDRRVYEAAWARCGELAGEGQGEKGEEAERWFVACHTWDVCAAKKFGFKTGLVLSEQPPLGEAEQKAFWGMYGGEPTVAGRDLHEVILAILEHRKQEAAQ